jgi:transcriptional regulator with XRE-family HTH domain
MRKQSLDRLYRAFGNLVRRGREQQGLSQKKLGSLVGLSRTSITNIEQGRHHITVHQLLAFARALKVRPEALLPSLPASWFAKNRRREARGFEKDI